MKKIRKIRTFEPDPDVEEMLDEATKAGLKMVDIINEATRQCGRDIIDRMATERLKQLRKLSFENPQVLLPGIAA